MDLGISQFDSFGGHNANSWDLLVFDGNILVLAFDDSQYIFAFEHLALCYFYSCF